MVTISQKFIFKWRFCWCGRLCRLSSLMCYFIFFFAIHEIITDNLENIAALKNFSFNKYFSLFPRVNETVAFDI